MPVIYKWQAVAVTSLGAYFINLPLKPHQATVLLFNGQKKMRQDVHAAIINMEICNTDLQQCANAVMQLRT